MFLNQAGNYYFIEQLVLHSEMSSLMLYSGVFVIFMISIERYLDWYYIFIIDYTVALTPSLWEPLIANMTLPTELVEVDYKYMSFINTLHVIIYNYKGISIWMYVSKSIW